MAALWDDSERPALGSMSSTTNFEDNSAGDTATYEEASDSDTFGSGCAQHSALAQITGVLDLGSVQTVLDWSVTCRQEADIGNAALCAGTGLDEDFDGWEDRRGWLLETSADGTSWSVAEEQPEQFATFTAGVLTRNHVYAQTLSGDFAEGTSARYIRFYLWIQVSSYDQNDTVYAKARISDMRASTTPPDPEDDPPGGTPCEEFAGVYQESAAGEPQVLITIG